MLHSKPDDAIHKLKGFVVLKGRLVKYAGGGRHSGQRIYFYNNYLGPCLGPVYPNKCIDPAISRYIEEIGRAHV